MKCLFYIAFIIVLSLSACLKTEGVLILKGKIVDEKTKNPIPGRAFVIQALIGRDSDKVTVNAGQTSTDSTGDFNYSLRKIKNAYYYNFYLVGDSDYAFRSSTIGLMMLEDNARFLIFPLSKLVELKINISRMTKTPGVDTLYMTMESNNIDGRILYPYRLDNYGQKMDLGLCWIGGKVKSTVSTKVFSDKKTRVYFDLFRIGRKMEFTDTITCRREAANSVNFVY